MPTNIVIVSQAQLDALWSDLAPYPEGQCHIVPVVPSWDPLAYVVALSIPAVRYLTHGDRLPTDGPVRTIRLAEWSVPAGTDHVLQLHEAPLLDRPRALGELDAFLDGLAPGA